ncbi:substrate-binding periplasmic protein [Spartinivicinus poritis]|uniref:Transporter substrate-binding domain-containing protein n=1 Tax=Spartinivicinus poritis TaxID=2994640 RepID=A0ABT5UIT9_9GAMM|nr:transporter substrate-binding domain-containing protein [Spartinivicinus sp. A2-2]MDE1465901.1 transporter substrate-binding domain-containing protein [Spartinivicinus sp. A2-2]
MKFALIIFTFITHASSANEALRGSLPSFPPFYDEQDLNGGAVVKLYKKIEKQLGLKLEVIPLPYARILMSLKTGDIDMAIIFKNSSIKEHVSYLAKVSESQVLVWTKMGISLENYSELKNLSIATIRKASFSEKYDNDQTIRKFYVDNYVQGLKMLDLGHIDGIVGSYSGIEYAAKRANVNLNTLGSPLLINSKEWWVHYSKKSKHQYAMKKIKKIAEGLYEKDLVYKLYVNSE